MAPVYAVGGFPRSGTSMVMRCMEAGGLPCVYDRRGDDNRNRVRADYVPNPHGFYEDAPVNDPESWPGFRGKCVKLVRDNLCFVPAGTPLAVCYMTRDPAEIGASYLKLLSGPHPDPLGWLAGYWPQVDSDVSGLRAAGHAVTVLHYPDVVADPHAQLERLGWPVDVGAAAAAVDPTLYRHRGG